MPTNRYVIFFALALLGVTADLLTKWLIFDNYFDPTGNYQEPVWLINQYLGIQCSTNPGALFGLGRGYSWLFATVSVVAIVGLIIWLFPLKAAVDRWLTIAIGLISGGILGNFYDRIGLGWRSTYPTEIKANVRDWIYFRIEGVWPFDPWPNFNIADSLLVCGAIMLFIHAIFQREPVDSDEPVEAGTESS